MIKLYQTVHAEHKRKKISDIDTARITGYKNVPFKNCGMLGQNVGTGRDVITFRALSFAADCNNFTCNTGFCLEDALICVRISV